MAIGYNIVKGLVAFTLCKHKWVRIKGSKQTRRSGRLFGPHYKCTKCGSSKNTVTKLPVKDR